VGCGLAGIAFAERALLHGKSILVFENNSQNSSKIAGGLYNPVILKRFSEVWDAQQQLNLLNDFYIRLEKKLQTKLDFKTPILRKFFSIEEQNNWFAASDKPNLSPFLSTKLITKQYNGIDAPFLYGEVLQTGFVNTALLIDLYKKHLEESNCLKKELFDYQDIKFENNLISYKNTFAKHLVFAEGFGMHSNPFFNYLPLDGTKGELFIIKAPNLKIDVIINTSVFILPLGEDLFKVGATYNWKEKDQSN
jgi:glycine oxidase